ncbi:vilya [Oratosquilla oratoria]|uniref:vilya n=1 Tax=Oratosquilla oratoria TaxID=337810 RepID=UPI003F76ABCB
MDWINCNICCRQPGDNKDRTFMLSSCGHLFCDICLSKAESREKCMACKAQCQFIQLSSKMKADAQTFFLEPSALLKKHHAQILHLLDFQNEHRIRLISFHRKVLLKYQELEKKYNSTVEYVHRLENENKKLQEALQKHSRGPGSSPVSRASPHDSYQRTIFSSQKPSPQPRTSPSSSVIPGRMTLVKPLSGTVVPQNSATVVAAQHPLVASVHIPKPSQIPEGPYVQTNLAAPSQQQFVSSPSTFSQVVVPQDHQTHYYAVPAQEYKQATGYGVHGGLYHSSSQTLSSSRSNSPSRSIKDGQSGIITQVNPQNTTLIATGERHNMRNYQRVGIGTPGSGPCASLMVSPSVPVKSGSYSQSPQDGRHSTTFFHKVPVQYQHVSGFRTYP